MSIYMKVAKAKKEIGKISKDSKNPHFGNTYFDINKLLEVIEPILEKEGLMVLQPIENGHVCTRIFNIDANSGDTILTSSMKLPELNDPQKMGSAITYYRRYTLQSLLALQSEDDDGNHAAGHNKQSNNKGPSTMPWLNEGSDEFKEIQVYIENGQLTDVDQITKFRISKKTRDLLTKLIKA